MIEFLCDCLSFLFCCRRCFTVLHYIMLGAGQIFHLILFVFDVLGISKWKDLDEIKSNESNF